MAIASTDCERRLMDVCIKILEDARARMINRTSNNSFGGLESFAFESTMEAVDRVKLSIIADHGLLQALLDLRAPDAVKNKEGG